MEIMFARLFAGLMLAFGVGCVCVAWLRPMLQARLREIVGNASAEEETGDADRISSTIAPLPQARSGAFRWWVTGAILAGLVLLDRCTAAGLSSLWGNRAASVRPFMVGLASFKSANFLLAMVVILFPLLRWRSGSLKGRWGASIAVYAATFAICLIQSITIKAYLVEMSQAEVGAMVGVLTAAVFLLDALILILSALALRRLWDGNGFTVVVATMAGLQAISRIRVSFASIIQEGVALPHEHAPLWVPSLIVLMFLVCAWGWLQVHPLELRDRRGGDTTVRLSIPCALTGQFPIAFAVSLAMGLSMLLRLVGWQSRYMAYGHPVYVVILSALICLCAFAYGIVLLPPGRLKARLAASDLELIPSSLPWALHAPWVAVLVVLYGVLPLLNTAMDLPLVQVIALRSVLLLGALLTLACVRKITLSRRGWQVVFEHPEFTEIIAVRALLARGGMASVVTWREPFGALSGMFVGPLADKRVSVAPENAAEAAGLIEEYQSVSA